MEVEKTVVFFLGRIPNNCDCTPQAVATEHTERCWIPLKSPVKVDRHLDPLLRQVYTHLCRTQAT